MACKAHGLCALQGRGGNYWIKTSGIWRDRLADARPAWIVRDGNYLSARWPDDAHTFAQQFVQLLAMA